MLTGIHGYAALRAVIRSLQRRAAPGDAPVSPQDCTHRRSSQEGLKAIVSHAVVKVV